MINLNEKSRARMPKGNGPAVDHTAEIVAYVSSRDIQGVCDDIRSLKTMDHNADRAKVWNDRRLLVNQIEHWIIAQTKHDCVTQGRRARLLAAVLREKVNPCWPSDREKQDEVKRWADRLLGEMEQLEFVLMTVAEDYSHRVIPPDPFGE